MLLGLFFQDFEGTNLLKTRGPGGCSVTLCRREGAVGLPLLTKKKKRKNEDKGEKPSQGGVVEGSVQGRMDRVIPGGFQLRIFWDINLISAR